MYAEILTILATAVVVVWGFKQLKLPPILAYIITGAIVGEHGLALTDDAVNYEHIAEFGIVFMLFTLGLEFSVPKMIAMRHLVLKVGSLQVVLTIALFTFIAIALGYRWDSAIVVASILSLSSTAIVIRQLDELNELKTKAGQTSVAVLLFQDVAVVPLLIIVPLLAGSEHNVMLSALFEALVKGVFVVAILLMVGKWLLPRLFHTIARVKNSELFVLTTLLVTLLAAAFTQWFGLSMALGAFLAGMMLGESKYKYQLQSDIRPYRDILLGLFFVTVGMKLNFALMISAWWQVILIVITFMGLKLVIVAALSYWQEANPKENWTAGIMLSQMGEFGFVLLALASQYQILSQQQSALLLVVGVLSMLIAPLLVKYARQIAAKLVFGQTELVLVEAHNEQDIELKDHVIICGFGRVGQTITRFLKKDNIPSIAIDIDPLRVKEAREAGENVLFGSSSQTELLHAANIHHAKLVVVAFGDDKESLAVVQKVRSLSSTIRILVRTRSDEYLQELKQAGANDVVPEILEGSLMLVSQVLSLSGTPLSRIIKRLQVERNNHYDDLHGFFPGETTNVNPNTGEKLEFAHAINLTEDAFAIGMSIGELKLKEKKVAVISVLRDEQEITDVADDFVLQVLDTIVIRGKPHRVERVERFLQEGEQILL